MITLLAYDPCYKFAYFSDVHNQLKFMYVEGHEIHDSDVKDMSYEIDHEAYVYNIRKFRDDIELAQFVNEEHLNLLRTLIETDDLEE